VPLDFRQRRFAGSLIAGLRRVDPGQAEFRARVYEKLFAVVHAAPLVTFQKGFVDGQ